MGGYNHCGGQNNFVSPGYGGNNYGCGYNNFALIVVLFILLIIVGAAFYC
ncbi:YjcZ family sporulation protein [Allobacillus sp. GCM10007491]|uniref:YjcZ family sporulation protein n=2 Tax=Allobacillus TaxID=1400133 RepID=A0A941CW57_9BACI|nr:MULTISPECIES: YjcZ family sporulation protein [Allobacillus]MBR7553503.1 YjcZ family sporulation protein [Allobacillus saliphilus]TSJ65338.1 YjcZ family sporulation protein [Allobacillus salarius]